MKTLKLLFIVGLFFCVSQTWAQYSYYHFIEDGSYYYIKDDATDNYTDLAINISRNFSDKSLFRERVDNKLDCESLM